MYAKGCVRQGQALHGLGMYRQATHAFETALQVWIHTKEYSPFILLRPYL